MNQNILDQMAHLVDRVSGKATGPKACLHRIPVNVYTDENHFEREWQNLFSNRPIVLCHESELKEAGDALVHDNFRLPLITVKDKTGRIATFMNVCRHRGMRLVQNSGFQTLRSLVCPYHQWTYGLNGELKNIPCEDDFANIQKTDLGLVELATEVRHGLVWLQLKAGSMNLSEHLDTLGEDLDAFGLSQNLAYKNNTRELACNWKLIHDAFLDGYHVIRLHKNSIGSFFPDNLAVSQNIGLHIRSAVGRNEILEANSLPQSEWHPRTLCTFSYTVFPNAIVIMHPDYTSLVSLYPQSVDRTVLSHTMLLAETPKTNKAKAHFDRSFELIDQSVFQNEDFFACEKSQLGMNSGANQALLLGANELSVKQFHDSVEREINR